MVLSLVDALPGCGVSKEMKTGKTPDPPKGLAAPLNPAFLLSTGQGETRCSLLNEKRLYNDTRRCKDAFGGGRVDIKS